MESRTYHISEFIQDYEDLLPLVMDELDKMLNVDSYGFCYPLKIQNNTNTLNIYSLIPISVLNKYEGVIPDNNFKYRTNLAKLHEVSNDITVEIELISKKIKIDFPITQYVFQKSLEENINFPEDYFQKGYPILAELLTKQFVNLPPSIKNTSYSIIKAITHDYFKNLKIPS